MTCNITKRKLLRIIGILLALCVLAGCCILGINTYVVRSTRAQILSAEDAAALTDVDCILVLGCYVNQDGEPSAMLSDRLKRSIELYNVSAVHSITLEADCGNIEGSLRGVKTDYEIDVEVDAGQTNLSDSHHSGDEEIKLTATANLGNINITFEE